MPASRSPASNDFSLGGSGDRPLWKLASSCGEWKLIPGLVIWYLPWSRLSIGTWVTTEWTAFEGTLLDHVSWVTDQQPNPSKPKPPDPPVGACSFGSKIGTLLRDCHVKIFQVSQFCVLRGVGLNELGHVNWLVVPVRYTFLVVTFPLRGYFVYNNIDNIIVNFHVEIT